MSLTPTDVDPASDIGAEAERQKTAMLYRNAGVAQLLTAVNASFLAYVNTTLHTSPRAALTWWGMILIIAAARFVLSRRFLAECPDVYASVHWRRWYIAGTSLAAATWGAGVVFFMWHAPEMAFMFTGVVLTGMVAGALPILAPVPTAFRVFALLILLPMATVIFLQGDSALHLAFGSMALIFLAALLIGARYLHETLDVSIRLGLEQGHLARSIEQARNAAETALAVRNQAEQSLQLAASVFANSQEGIMITAVDGRIIDVNDAFSVITGFSSEEVVGRTPHILRSGRHEASFYASMWDAIKRNGSWQGEVWNRRKNGEIYPEWLTITEVRDSDRHVTHYVGTFADISQRKAAEDEIKYLAFYDSLTRLPNRRLLKDRLNHAMLNSTRSGGGGALLLIDLDNFKTLNDTLGHDMGDTLLEQLAQRLVGCVRECDTVARIGGDEFVVMLENLSENQTEAATQARIVGEKILAKVNQPVHLGTHRYQGGSSIGATLFSGVRDSVDELLKQADLAMYQAKAAGRNNVRFFDQGMQAVVNARAELESDLRQGLNRNEFVLFYQPQVDLDSLLTGAEALVRWRHPERGMVPPNEFIFLAEETGLIQPLGFWVLETACSQLADWAGQPGLNQLTLAVNVSARQFRHPNFTEQVRAVLDKTGADPKRLKLEITESLLLDDVEGIIGKMTSLKAQGISFSLDDFGTGYSSLAYLKRLPLDQLKIDQSFVRDVLTDPNDATIAKTIVALAHSLGISVIAEGVETRAQRDFLLQNGCAEYQGYLFGRPGPVEEIERRVKSDRVFEMQTE